MNLGLTIIQWYQLNKRELPWRNTRNPYFIWLSEIILQQTRVTQGLPYYYRFAKRFPDILSFANASEDEVLKLWQGVGYYSRVRNMLSTAKEIQKNHAGIFPTAYADLIKLKGLGPYTSSAISSFSVDEKRAVVDGNVYRVIARFIGLETPINTSQGVKIFQKWAYKLLDNHTPSIYNQAIMEFGALFCKHKKPDCVACVLKLNCWAFNHNKVDSLPAKLKKNIPKKRHIYFFVIRNNDKLIIKKRGNGDIWAGLYDFPSVENNYPQAIDAVIAHADFGVWFSKPVVVHKVFKPIKHQLTHQTIFATFIEILGFDFDSLPCDNWLTVTVDEIEIYPQPKLIFAFLKNYLT